MYLKDEDGEEGEDEESEGSQEGSHRHLLYAFFVIHTWAQICHLLDYDLGTMVYDGQGGDEFNFQGGHKNPAARDCLFRLCSVEE